MSFVVEKIKTGSGTGKWFEYEAVKYSWIGKEQERLGVRILSRVAIGKKDLDALNDELFDNRSNWTKKEQCSIHTFKKINATAVVFSVGKPPKRGKKK